MPKTERVREVISGPFDGSYFQTKMNKGWRLAAVHWERDAPGEATEQAALNRQGSRTRRGTAWTQTAIFNMLPRLIEAAPYIWRSESKRASSVDQKL